MNRQSSAPSSVSMGFGNVMFGKSCTHGCSVFVWLFSDERRSVQPSNQVHRGLHWPSQHLHRNRVLSQRQPAGRATHTNTHSAEQVNDTWHYTSVKLLFEASETEIVFSLLLLQTFTVPNDVCYLRLSCFALKAPVHRPLQILNLDSTS